jgi:hypothetical protein
MPCRCGTAMPGIYSGMPQKLTELDAAVQRLYDAFSAVQPREEIRTGFCHHCVSTQDSEMLAATPLRDIGPGLLRHFMWNALACTWGTPDDLEHYLPRILELVANGEYDTIDTGSSFRRLPWREWPRREQAALSGYLTAPWRATITTNRPPGAVDALHVLEVTADLGMSVEPFLHEWEKDSSETVALRLARFIQHDLSPRDPSPDAEWEQALDLWITSPPPRRIVAAALASARTLEAAAILSGALKILDSWSSVP